MKPATADGPYKVPRQHNGLRSGLMAVAMHAVLLMFLWVGVSWQNNEPTEVQAEIWDMKVQDAAPPAPTPEPKPAPEPEPEPEPVKAPPPQPVQAPPVPKEDPEIALERLKAKKKEEDRQEKLEQARLKKEADEKLAKLEAKKKADQKAKEEKEKAEQEEKDKALAAEKEKDKKKAAAEKLAKEKAEKADKAAKDKAFAAEMSRITGSAAKGTTGTAAQSTGGKVDGGYASKIRAKIKSNLVYGSQDDSLAASYTITQLPTGEIIGIRKVKSSGSSAYDSAIENAISKSSPLPTKNDGTVEREITLDFKLKEMH
ncbi:cell envelope integrity protein TolA [Duganella dendranthematis]|jgi:colicin import membrane protein|uniref:Cell envelope integrity protein TolA n=1 Tax=Duganella dendranthematis TaxID=2728021 RepID=A0ABX6MD23_9BURK|nr:cell envelope integrity protein TolA [Duganella dendranthematis]QJD92227.1 cell envelope integrity protein TolA [Duganella dendranthematis]